MRGLRTTGDKVEMMLRLLLHIIDPEINFSELSGREPTLSFITEEDVNEGKVKIVPEDERNVVNYANELGGIREKGLRLSSHHIYLRNPTLLTNPSLLNGNCNDPRKI